MSKVPVVLFVFRRPDLTSQVFERIREYRPNQLFLIADGPRQDKPREVELSQETLRVIEGVDWPCEVYRDFATTNLGLRKRILSGLDFVFNKVEKAIILEDDCLPSRSFFAFMESMLEKYEPEPRVGLVSGSNFSPYASSASDYHFSAAPYIWGWGTWSRDWNDFRKAPQVESWSAEEEAMILSDFSSRSQGRAFVSMMKDAKNLNTWDISFAVWFRQNHKMAIVPRVNLVRNLGFGAEATHTKFEAFDVDVPAGELVGELRHPKEFAIDHSRERKMWRSKQLKWITFPLLHPLDFTFRFVRFVRARATVGK